MHIKYVLPSLALMAASTASYADCAAQATAAQERLAHKQADHLPELLTPQLRPSFPTDAVQQAYDALASKWGEFQHAAPPTTLEKNGHHLAVMPLSYAHGQVNLVVACDADQMIDGIHFVPAQGGAP
ncbi:MAG: hypothetical protein AAGC76_05090 [Luteibacter sp.]|uniref:hypothetical protein n=1 Tax=Luteibacter sp. TaxID=1886636 RepID=UPI0028090F71|nr:hypothetical protein [Luteibacter sp.]MDQ7995212.1 hypothetical protein [Luteibacter sp.]